MSEKKKEGVELYGKVARLPKNSDLKHFMENIKIPKNKLWYILVEKQDNEVHAVKTPGLNSEQTFKMNTLVIELKKHYIQYFTEKKQSGLVDLINKIEISGNDEFSVIKNVPKATVNGVMLVTRITEDLIRLLDDRKAVKE